MLEVPLLGVQAFATLAPRAPELTSLSDAVTVVALPVEIEAPAFTEAVASLAQLDGVRLIKVKPKTEPLAGVPATEIVGDEAVDSVPSNGLTSVPEDTMLAGKTPDPTKLAEGSAAGVELLDPV